MHLKAVIEQVWTSTVTQLMDGVPGVETSVISKLTRNCANVTR